MLRVDKSNFVLSLEQLYKDNEVVMLIHYHGLTVAKMTALRKTLRESNGGMKVVKNTLAKIAAKNSSINGLDQALSGPVAIAYSNDASVLSKIVVGFIKENPTVAIVGGVIENQSVPVSTLEHIAELPPLVELRAKIIGTLLSPSSKLLTLLNTPARNLVSILDAYSRKDQLSD